MELYEEWLIAHDNALYDGTSSYMLEAAPDTSMEIGRSVVEAKVIMQPVE